MPLVFLVLHLIFILVYDRIYKYCTKKDMKNIKKYQNGGYDMYIIPLYILRSHGDNPEDMERHSPLLARSWTRGMDR